MARVSFGNAWLLAWKEAPQAVRDSTLMTRCGQPIGKLRDHGVLRVVLGEAAPAALIGRARTKTVSSAEATQLAAVVRARGAELDACRRLFEQVQDARLRFQLGPRGDAETNSMLVKRLWQDAVTDQATVDDLVREYGAAGGGGDRSGLVESADALAEQECRLLKAWPSQPPVRSASALHKPEELTYFHNRIEDDQWLRAVEWVRTHELRGWEQDLGLSDRPMLTCPPASGPSQDLQPLDRPLSAWLSGRTREAKRVGKKILMDDLVSDEIACATSSLGLRSDEARAVMLLGYWLVAHHRFDLDAGVVWLPDKARVAEVLADPGSADEAERVKVRYVLMMRAMWNQIRGLARGTIERPGRDWIIVDDPNRGRTVTSTAADAETRSDAIAVHDLAPSLGDQLMQDPLRSFMKRLWPTVHTYSHRGPITAVEATHLLKYGWERWARLVGTALAQPPLGQGPVARDPAALEELLLTQITTVITNGPTSLALQIARSDNPAELADLWRAAVDRVGITRTDAALTRVDDVGTVHRYLRAHLSGARHQKRFTQ
jgi:hypothetical protein